MRKISCRIVCALLIGAAPCILSAKQDQNAAVQRELLMSELDESDARGVAALPSDEESIEALERAASSGNVGAEAILADAFAAEVGNGETLAQARLLYSNAAGNGVPLAYLGLAKVSLLEDSSSKGRSNGSLLLREASSRGSAEADRLLARLAAWGAKDAGDRAEAWQLLVRAAQRGDAVACIEVSEACMSGSWNGLSVTVDEAAAVEMLRIGVGQMSPRAALMLAMYLTRDGIGTAQEDYDESVELLYNALVWAHDSEPGLIEEIDGLRDDGRLYIRTWLLARHLYEDSINPALEKDTDVVAGEIEAKVWYGVRMTLKIEGAANGSMLSMLGFPYDAPYLWDGEVVLNGTDCLSVSKDDPFWTAVMNMQGASDLPLYVKVLDGKFAGQIVSVNPEWVAGEDRVIEIEDGFEGLFEAPTRVALGRWRSLYSVFGRYNEVGLRPGASANDADQIILFNPSSQKALRYYFDSELLAWVNEDSPDAVAEDAILPPWVALFVLRREEAPLYLTIDGVISGSPTPAPAYYGYNLLSNVEGRLLDKLIASGNTGSVVRADSLPVCIADEFGNLSISGRELKSASWCRLLGISPNASVYVNDVCAIVMVTDSEVVELTAHK